MFDFRLCAPASRAAAMRSEGHVMHEGRRIASETPTFLSGLMAYKGEPQTRKSTKRALFRELPDTKLHAACRTHIGGGTHAKATCYL